VTPLIAGDDFLKSSFFRITPPCHTSNGNQWNEFMDRFVSQIVINWIGRIVASYVQLKASGVPTGCCVFSRSYVKEEEATDSAFGVKITVYGRTDRYSLRREGIKGVFFPPNAIQLERLLKFLKIKDALR